MHLERRDRLRIAISKSNLAKGTVAAKAHMHRQVLTDMLAGKVPGDRHLANLAEVLDVDERWLSDGTHPPKWLDSVISATVVEPRSDDADFADQTVKRILLAWAELRSRHHLRYEQALSRLSSSARPWVLADGRQKGAFTTAIALELGTEVGIPKPEEIARFRHGHRLQMSAQFNAGEAGGALPDDAFELIREGLLLLRAQRRIRHESEQDVDGALRLVWTRYLSSKKSGQEELMRRMKADVGS